MCLLLLSTEDNNKCLTLVSSEDSNYVFRCYLLQVTIMCLSLLSTEDNNYYMYSIAIY